MIHARSEAQRRELTAPVVLHQLVVGQEVLERIRKSLRLKYRPLFDPPAGADQGIAGTREQGGIGLDRSRAILQPPREAVVQTPEPGLSRLAQIEVGEQPPQGDAGGAQPGLLDAADPPHELRRPAARNAVGEQEIEVFLLREAADHGAHGHLSVTLLQYSSRRNTRRFEGFR